MKKTHIILIIMCVTIVFCSGFVCFGPTITCTGSSDLYTKAEIQDAIDYLNDEFKNSDDSKAYILAYAGDKYNSQNVSYAKEYSTQIVIKSIYKAPKIPINSNKTKIYKENIILVQNENGEWHTLVTRPFETSLKGEKP